MSMFVVDEHPLMREAITATLRRLNPSVLVTELDSLDAADQAALAHGNPDFICVELLTGGNQGVSAVHHLKRQFAAVPIVVLSSETAEKYEKLAFDAGAQTYIHKSASKAKIAKTLRDFIPGDPGEQAHQLPEKLCKRQKQLLILLDKGMSNRDIADHLQISEHTVKGSSVAHVSQASHLARTHVLVVI